MPCAGNAETHCCWVGGEVCQYLEENTVSGRRWACGLRRKLGDWDAVLDSPEYKKNIAPVFAAPDRLVKINCRDWPDQPEGIKCTGCGHGY